MLYAFLLLNVLLRFSLLVRPQPKKEGVRAVFKGPVRLRTESPTVWPPPTLSSDPPSMATTVWVSLIRQQEALGLHPPPPALTGVFFTRQRRAARCTLRVVILPRARSWSSRAESGTATSGKRGILAAQPGGCRLICRISGGVAGPPRKDNLHHHMTATVMSSSSVSPMVLLPMT